MFLANKWVHLPIYIPQIPHLSLENLSNLYLTSQIWIRGIDSKVALLTATQSSIRTHKAAQSDPTSIDLTSQAQQLKKNIYIKIFPNYLSCWRKKIPRISLYKKLCNYYIILPTKQAQLCSFDSANRGNNNKSINLMTKTPFTEGAKLWDRKWRGPDSATSAYSQDLNSLKHCRKGSK